MSNVTYRFGSFTLDVAEQRLERDGVPVPVPPKTFETLTILVEQQGGLVRRGELIARLWPDSVVEDSTLARYISDLRKLLGETASGEKFIETVPRVGYRFAVPVQVLTPHHTISPVPQAKPRNWTWAMSGVLMLLIAAVAWTSWRSASGQPQKISTVAVLPFVSLDGDANSRVLGQELADAVITRLSASDRVVRPTSSVLSYTNAPRDVLAAARELRVDAIMDGSIHRSSGTTRVTVRLIRTSDGRSVWSSTFDEPDSTFFDLEDAVGERMGRALGWPGLVKTRATEERGNETAKSAYYQGRYWLAQRNRDGLLNAIACFQRAAAADPHYARAQSGLAQAYLLYSGYGFASPAAPYVAMARQAVQESLRIDPSLGEAHSVRGLLAESYDADWDTTKREYRTAIELNPQDATAHHLYGEFLAYMGHFDEGREHLRRAQELDPTSLIVEADYAETYILSGQFDQAEKLSNDVLKLDPHFSRARLWFGIAAIAKGDCRSAEAIASEADAGNAQRALVAIIDARCGDGERARAAVKKLDANVDSSYYAAAVYTALGDKKDTIRMLQRALNNNRLGLVNLKVHPLFNPLRGDPKFQAVIAQLNFPQ